MDTASIFPPGRDFKWCTKGRHWAAVDGRQWKRRQCPDCRNAEGNRRYHEKLKFDPAHPEKKRWERIRRKYGLSKLEWVIIFARQGHKCDSCGTTDPGHKNGWMTDHCHQTGRVRGILCNFCNVGVAVEETIGLETIRAYLEKHR